MYRIIHVNKILAAHGTVTCVVLFYAKVKLCVILRVKECFLCCFCNDVVLKNSSFLK